MIDLNDVGTPKARHDLAAVKDRLAATAGDWLPGIFPEARLARDRRSLRCADLSGRPPRKEGSCTIHLDGPYAGWGFDYATGESAGPIDLIAQATGLCDGALFDEAARIAGMDHPAPRNAPRAKPDHTGEIARLIDGAQPLAGTSGETYLRKSLRGGRITPGEWERRRGLRLRLVYRRTGPSLLVAEGRLNTKGQAVVSRSKTGRGKVTAPIFLLVPQVRLPKRLDLARDAERALDAVPGLIVANWAEDRLR